MDLLGKLLAFDPDERIDVTTALQHPYVGTYHDPADEPSCATPFDKWEEVEGLQTIEELREAITREISEYRAEVRGLAELGDGFGDDEYEYEEEEGEAEGEEEYEEYVEEPEEVLNEPEAVAVPQHRFPEAQRSALGISQPRSPSASPRSRRVTLPNQRRATKREESPATPGTTISEESFGHTPHAATVGRHSRRSSNISTHSVSHRRSMSFLFGGMTSLSMTSASGPAAAAPDANGPAVSSAEYTAGSSVVGRRSRAPSSTVDLGSLRPLIRQLSATNIADMRINTDDEAMHSEKSPRPIQMTSRRSSRGSRGSKSSRRPSSVCLAAETSGWRSEAEGEHKGEEADADADEEAVTEQPPATEDTARGDGDEQ